MRCCGTQLHIHTHSISILESFIRTKHAAINQKVFLKLTLTIECLWFLYFVCAITVNEWSSVFSLGFVTSHNHNTVTVTITFPGHHIPGIFVLGYNVR